jgi:transposase
MADRKQTFTPEFRAEAVRLAQTSGQSLREVAADLGVGLSTLRNWIDGRRAGHAADAGAVSIEAEHDTVSLVENGNRSRFAGPALSIHARLPRD